MFLEWLQAWRDSAFHRVRKGKDLVDIHQAQGELNVLERLLGLEIELKVYSRRKLQADIQENERQRVNKEV